MWQDTKCRFTIAKRNTKLMGQSNHEKIGFLWRQITDYSDWLELNPYVNLLLKIKLQNEFL